MIKTVRYAQSFVKSKRTAASCFLHTMTYDDRPDAAIRLQQAREARGFKAAVDATKFFGWSYDTYIQHENGTRGLVRAAAKYAKAFRVSEGWLLTGDGSMTDGPRMAPIVGKAGAGPEGTVQFYTGDGNFGEIEAPVDSALTVEALEVQGDSMYGIANDGWLLFYEEKEPPAEHHIGELCVCWLADERVLVKFPQPGSRKGLFNLESANAPTMRDVEINAFAIVTDIKTRRAGRRYVRRNSDGNIEDVKIA